MRRNKMRRTRLAVGYTFGVLLVAGLLAVGCSMGATDPGIDQTHSYAPTAARYTADNKELSFVESYVSLICIRSDSASTYGQCVPIEAFKDFADRYREAISYPTKVQIWEGVSTQIYPCTTDALPSTGPVPQWYNAVPNTGSSGLAPTCIGAGAAESDKSQKK